VQVQAAMRLIERDELELLATGAWILGAGGGGNPYLAWLNLCTLYKNGTRVALLDPMALADDDAVAIVASVGAPLVGRERLSDPGFATRPLLALQAHLGCRFRAVMSVEVGGSNALQPLLVAAMTGLPVVDADSMGRAFPEGHMMSFTIAGLPALPLAMADIRGTEVIVPRAADPQWMSRIARKVLGEMGAVTATCRAPRTGAEIKRHGILHSTSKAIGIGRTVHEARRRRDDPIAALVEAEQGVVLFKGKVQDIERRTTDSFLRGSSRLLGLDGDRGAVLKLEFQNEFAAAWHDGEVVATTPDIICIMDSDSGEAIGTEMIRYGQRVSVIVLPAPGFFLTAQGLAATGPRAFGYDFDYKAVL
jgi:uncharacterized protein